MIAETRVIEIALYVSAHEEACTYIIIWSLLPIVSMWTPYHTGFLSQSARTVRFKFIPEIGIGRGSKT